MQEQLPKAVAIWSAPIEPCGFYKNTLFRSTSTYLVSCYGEQRQLRERVVNITKLDPTEWLNNDAVASFGTSTSCWFDCLSPVNGLIWMKRLLEAQELVRSRVLPLSLFDAVCDGPNCLQASSELALSTSRTIFDTFKFLSFPDKLICVLAIVFNAVVVAAGLVVLILSVAVWKIFSVMKFYVVVLALVSVGHCVTRFGFD